MLNALSPAPAKQSLTRFVVSSIFLDDCRDYLTATNNERLVYISGPVTPDGTAVLSMTNKLPMSQQTPTYVCADTTASIQALDYLDTTGHRLWAVFHSHILRGATGTTPSQTDIVHQNRMVAFGMPQVLGGIFGTDGWCRIFSTVMPFELFVYGNGAHIVTDRPKEKLLRLETREADHVVAATLV